MFDFRYNSHRRWYWFNLIKADNMATESTKEHGKIAIKALILPCSFVDSVAIKKNAVTQLDLIQHPPLPV